MNKVYIVWYDNGAPYAEDHQVYINRVYDTAEEAEKYAAYMNTPLIPIEPILSEDDEWTIEFSPWEGKYFVTEQEVFTKNQ